MHQTVYASWRDRSTQRAARQRGRGARRAREARRRRLGHAEAAGTLRHTGQSDYAKGEAPRRSEKLYNKVVRVADQPPCYGATYWFVYQYVPDMEWVHLCPLKVVGEFPTHAKLRAGRPRYMLDLDAGVVRG